MFLEAAPKYKRGEREPEVVKVCEKIRPGIWAYNGLFKLVGAWKEKSSGRHVFKFKLELPGGHDFTQMICTVVLCVCARTTRPKPPPKLTLDDGLNEG